MPSTAVLIFGDPASGTPIMTDTPGLRARTALTGPGAIRARRLGRCRPP
ncbi:MAG: hypothetical protein ACRDOH_20015 [Streptosporangiaceae bacterium]